MINQENRLIKVYKLYLTMSGSLSETFILKRQLKKHRKNKLKFETLLERC